ncbi:MAG: hypothetical protein JJ864_13245 [Rhizobiaceae bacterium]|nr:hypothetical protein [Rhizobiaceae bacterium]
MAAGKPDRVRELRKPKQHSRPRLIRRVLLLQVKLFADGLRDFVMMPLSLAAAALGMLSSRNEPEVYLDRLMHFGRESDRWINLFDHYDTDDPGRPVSLDRLAEELEATVLRDYENGGLSARGADHLRDLVSRLRRVRNEAT